MKLETGDWRPAARNLLSACRGGGPARLAGALSRARATCLPPCSPSPDEQERREIFAAIVEELAYGSGHAAPVCERLLAHLAA